MEYIKNFFANDGSEFVIFFDNGSHTVKEYDYDDDPGYAVFDGTFRDCMDFVKAAIAAHNSIF